MSPLPSILTKREYFTDATLPLQVYIRDPQEPFPLHSHRFDELVVILKGTARHVVDGHDIPVKSGDVFVIARDQLHQYRDMHGLALANILFDARILMMEKWDVRSLPGFHALFSLEPALRSQQRLTSLLQLTDRQLNHVNGLIHDLSRETDAQTPGYRVMATGLFMQLAVYLSRCYTRDIREGSIGLLRIGDAIAHIETRYADNITLDELAAESHLSKRHFQRLFRNCLGRSPIDYLIHVRVQKAAELLSHSDRPITDIAFDCGFQDSNYFTRCFRRIMNRSPREYRSQPD